MLADSQKVFPFLKRKPFVYYFKGLTGAHLDITIVFTITANVLDEKQRLCGGMVLAETPKVYPVLKIKPLLYYFKGLSGVHLFISIDFPIFPIKKIKPLVY